MPGSADGLNENQKRYLLNTFRHVDGMLTAALELLRPDRPLSPLQAQQAGLSPLAWKRVAGQVLGLREEMVRILASQGVALPTAETSPAWLFVTAVLSAKDEVEEIGSRSMRGYGELSDAKARELETLRAKLMDRLDRMARELNRVERQDVGERSREALEGQRAETGGLRAHSERG